MLSYIFTCIWFDVTLQSDARKAPVETSVSAQLYVMTPDSLCCIWKRLTDLKTNIGRISEDSKGDNVKTYASITNH